MSDFKISPEQEKWKELYSYIAERNNHDCIKDGETIRMPLKCEHYKGNWTE